MVEVVLPVAPIDLYGDRLQAGTQMFGQRCEQETLVVFLSGQHEIESLGTLLDTAYIRVGEDMMVGKR